MIPVNAKYFKLSVGKLKKETPSEISCCCPACGDTKNRLHLIQTTDFDYVKCFNSGCELEESTSVLKFLQIINSSYISAYKRETLNEKIDVIKSGEDLGDILSRLKKEPEPKVETPSTPEIPLDKLFSKCTENKEAVDYLYRRNITPQKNWYFSTQKFFKFKDKQVYLQDYLLIPIYDDEYKYRGFYSRSIHEKTFSTFLLDGTEKIWRNNPTVFPDIICEGIFDALSTGYEYCAAMIGATVSDEYSDTLPKSTIFAFDNDNTGTLKAIQYAKKGFRVFVWPEVKEKDFNDLLNTKTPEQVKDLIENNLYKGIIAETRLRMKHI